MAEAAGRSGPRRRPAGEQGPRSLGAAGGRRGSGRGCGGPALPGICGRPAERERGGARRRPRPQQVRGRSAAARPCGDFAAFPRAPPRPGRGQPGGRRAELRWRGRRARAVPAEQRDPSRPRAGASAGPRRRSRVAAGSSEASAPRARNAAGLTRGAEPPGEEGSGGGGRRAAGFDRGLR